MTRMAATTPACDPADQTNTACTHCGLPVPAARRGGDAQHAFCCFGCRFAWELTAPTSEGGTPSAQPLFFRLGLGIFLTMNIMVFTWFFHSREWFTPEAQFNPLAAVLAYLLMFLCSGVVAVLGVPLAHDAAVNVLATRGRADTSLLISLGVGAAFVLSVINTIRGEGSLYFDTAAIILVLVTLGQYLDSSAKRHATDAAMKLLGSLRMPAWVERDGSTIEVDSDVLRIGDRLRVRPSESVPADGVVADGHSHVDESRLTGESRPRAVGPGDRVLAGSVNLEGMLRVEATQVGGERAIAVVQRLLADARRLQPPIQRLADRVAAVFVPGVMAVAVAVFAWHAWHDAAARGLFDALAVVLISCPCALGLAAPLASWTGLARAARLGIVIDSAVTLERAAHVRRIFFDKTGTLTDPRLVVTAVRTAHGVSETDALRWAASIEQTSAHPIAAAVTRLAAERATALLAVTDARVVPGLGVEAVVDGALLRLGSGTWAAQLGVHVPADDAGLAIHLMRGEAWLASFALRERLRDDARAAIGQLQRMGVAASILTGDGSGPAGEVAAALGVAVEHSLLPQDKLARLQAARAAARHRIAMAGDGINDGPVLAAADVGIAVAGGTDLAKQAGHVRLLADRLDRIPQLFALARQVHHRIRLSLAWAFGYNAIGVGLAVAGLLSPLFAATAMFVSSLLIIRLARGTAAADTMSAAAS